MSKLFSLIPRRRDITRAAFGTHWREVHGPLALRIEGLHRYVQHHGAGAVPGLPLPLYDGVSEAWFGSPWQNGAPPHHSDSSYVDRTKADERNFMDVDGRRYLEVEEHVLLDGRAADATVAIMIFLASVAHAPRADTSAQHGVVRHVRNIALTASGGGEHPPWAAIDQLWLNGAADASTVRAVLGPPAACAVPAFLVESVVFR
ncbi:MAG: hypothetical protein ABS81_02910 [Pseudonocardia sp. SCN 72-86]|nr:MAG: hypothetical protein ABS81_02910 [Pseudonocardia sp. SCN 72-86]